MLLLAVSVAPIGTVVLVQDASDDPDVSAGKWGLYFRVGSAGTTLDDWLLLTSGDLLDVDFSTFVTTTQLTAMKNVANGIAGLDSGAKVPVAQLPDATNAAKGVAMLSDSVTSTLNAATGVTAASPYAVKLAYDAANLLDAAFVANETDMATKNLRVGALVFMADDNDAIDP